MDAQPLERPARSGRAPAIGFGRRGALKGFLSFAAAATLLAFVLPRAAGAGWGTIVSTLGGVSVLALAGLGVVWFAGLLAHMVVMTSALPGLTVRRALLLSLTGSSVSNVLPMGGAAGTALNYSMCRRWGHSRAAFVLFSVVTHIWGLVAKLLLPALAMAGLLVAGRPSAHLAVACGVALAALVVLVTGLAGVLARESAAVALGRAGERAVSFAGRRARRPWRVELQAPARALRKQAIAMTRSHWHRPATGMLLYFGLQAVLLSMCLQAVGGPMSPLYVFAAYAVERLLTVVVLTPGGLGFVEVTMTAMLVAFGATPVAAAAGVLLYRAFTFALEIPVGGALLLGWLAAQRWSGQADPALVPFDPLGSAPVALHPELAGVAA